MQQKQNDTKHPDEDIELVIGHHELIISKRYEFFYDLNDMLIALWFLTGSTLLLNDGTNRTALWLFLIGSVQLFIRPMISISKKIHLKRISPGEVHPMIYRR